MTLSARDQAPRKYPPSDLKPLVMCGFPHGDTPEAIKRACQERFEVQLDWQPTRIPLNSWHYWDQEQLRQFDSVRVRDDGRIDLTYRKRTFHMSRFYFRNRDMVNLCALRYIKCTPIGLSREAWDDASYAMLVELGVEPDCGDF